MARRKNRSPKERARLFELNEGECYLCEGKIQAGERWEIEHVVPWELTHDDSDDNIRLAHYKCHKPKSANDVKEIRRADRLARKNIGIKKKSQFPCARDGKFKQKLDGTVVRRDK